MNFYLLDLIFKFNRKKTQIKSFTKSISYKKECKKEGKVSCDKIITNIDIEFKGDWNEKSEIIYD